MKFDKNFLLILRQMLCDFEQAFIKVGFPEYIDKDVMTEIVHLQEVLENLVRDKNITLHETNTKKNEG